MDRCNNKIRTRVQDRVAWSVSSGTVLRGFSMASSQSPVGIPFLSM
jgi:hypothetical protein